MSAMDDRSHHTDPFERMLDKANDRIAELVHATEPFVWVRPFEVADDEVVHLTVTGAEMKALMLARAAAR